MPEIKFTPDWAKLRQRKLFLASPLYGGNLLFGFHQSVCNLVSLCHKHNLSFGNKYICNDSLVPRARNRLVSHFRESDCTDFLFVDGDITMSPEDMLSLLTFDQPIIAGIYSRKQIDWGRVARAARANVPESSLPYFGTIPVVNWAGPVNDIKLDELFILKHAGTGCLRIRREVFETMISHYGDEIAFDYSGDEPVFKGKVGYDFFPVGIDRRFPLGSGSRQYLSEDWYFCERAMECGYKIYSAPWIKLVHTGSHDFPSDLGMLEGHDDE